MYNISNRRYTGSKYKLLDWLEELILDNCAGETFLDVFAGTGVVSDRMRRHYPHMIVNDFLYSNEVIYRAFFGAGTYDPALLEYYKEKYQSFGTGKEQDGAGDREAAQRYDNYFSANFGGKYFSMKDAGIIGAVREDLARNRDLLSEREYCILLASLLYSMDKVANTVGHYDAYRKREGIEDRFLFDLISPQDCGGQFAIYREDANRLARRLKADIAFVDPPYNSRQYSRFYHVLENVTQWKKPPLTGTALKPPEENMSDYCRNNAPEIFADLIRNLGVKYIVVTYNNTYNSKSSSSRNKITLEEIRSILERKGETSVYEKRHPCFNAGKTEFEDHREFVFITKAGADHEKE